MNSWPTLKLVDLASKIGSGATPRGGKASYHLHGIPLIRSMNVRFEGFFDHGLAFLDDEQACQLDGVKVEARDVLLNITGASIGRVTVAPDYLAGARVNQHVCIIRPHDCLLPKFLAHFLASPTQQSRIMEQHVGVTRPGLTKQQVCAFDVPVPSLETQRRIVAEIEKQLSRLDAGLAALRRVEANLKRYKAAVLKAACTGALTADWRAAHPDVEPASQLLDRILQDRRSRWEEAELAKLTANGKRPKGVKLKLIYEEPGGPGTTDLPVLPRSWCWATAEQLTPFDRSAAYGVLQPGPDLEDGVEFVRICDIREGAILRDQLKRIAKDIAASYPRTRLRGGEVLVTLVGTIGRSAVVPGDLAGANTARAVGVIPLTDRLNARFVELCFRNPSKIRELTGKAHEVARKTLNLEDLRATSIPLPPLSEQNEIVDRVEDLMSISLAAETAVDQNTRRAARLRQSILRDAFAGKLVEQDPRDAPAGALFAQIQAERSSLKDNRILKGVQSAAQARIGV